MIDQNSITMSVNKFQYSAQLTIPGRELKKDKKEDGVKIAELTYRMAISDKLSSLLPVEHVKIGKSKDFTFRSDFWLIPREDMRSFLMQFLADNISEDEFTSLIFDVKARKALKNMKG